MLARAHLVGEASQRGRRRVEIQLQRLGPIEPRTAAHFRCQLVDHEIGFQLSAFSFQFSAADS